MKRAPRRSPTSLTGDVNPGGKLPITYPRSVGQIPTYYGHKISGGRSHWKGDYVDSPATPLYPFGHGLSYTTFRLSDAVAGDISEVTWNDVDHDDGHGRPTRATATATRSSSCYVRDPGRA